MAHARQLRFERVLRVALETCNFGFQCASGRAFCGLPCRLRIGLELLLCLGPDPRDLGRARARDLLARAFQLRGERVFGFRANARDFCGQCLLGLAPGARLLRLERGACFRFGGGPCLARHGIHTRRGGILCLRRGEPRLLGVAPQARQLRFQLLVAVALDPRGFRVASLVRLLARAGQFFGQGAVRFGAEACHFDRQRLAHFCFGGGSCVARRGVEPLGGRAFRTRRGEPSLFGLVGERAPAPFRASRRPRA